MSSVSLEDGQLYREKKKYEQQYRDGTLLNHSDYAEIRKDYMTMWIAVKDRYSVTHPKSVIHQIMEWCDSLNIETDVRTRSNDMVYVIPRYHLQLSNRFFVGFFPAADWQVTAMKLAWGEYLISEDVKNELCASS